MKKMIIKLRLLCTVALVFFVNPVLSSEVKSLTSDSDDYQTILKITRDYYAAWSYTKDDTVYDQAGRYYSKNPDNVYWDPLPPLEGHRGWDAYRNVIKNIWIPAGMEAAGILFANDGSFQAWRFGDVIWTTANCIVHAHYNSGISATMPCRGTQIWINENGLWLVAHEHFSATVNPGDKLFQGTRNANNHLKTNAEFLKLSKQLTAVWSEGSVDTAGVRLKKFYTEDYPVRLYMPWTPHDGFQTWTAFEQGLDEYLSLTAKKITLVQHDDLEATQSGDIAWSTATVHFNFEQHDDTQVSADGRQTLIWIRQGNNWVIVHEHLSIPMS